MLLVCKVYLTLKVALKTLAMSKWLKATHILRIYRESSFNYVQWMRGNLRSLAYNLYDNSFSPRRRQGIVIYERVPLIHLI